MTRALPCGQPTAFAVRLTLVPSSSVDARASGYAEAVVSVDNYTSKAHTVLQVRVCAHSPGLHPETERRLGPGAHPRQKRAAVRQSARHQGLEGQRVVRQGETSVSLAVTCVC